MKQRLGVEAVGNDGEAAPRFEYTLRTKVNSETQPVVVALIEAKAAHLPPAHGLEQAKLYAACKRLNVPLGP